MCKEFQMDSKILQKCSATVFYNFQMIFNAMQVALTKFFRLLCIFFKCPKAKSPQILVALVCRSHSVLMNLAAVCIDDFRLSKLKLGGGN
jgi:hypothetical protein